MFSKLGKFTERNGGSLSNALFRRYLANLYTNVVVRKIASPFVTLRKPEKWLFLVGCYNSGTTICRDILGVHPEISTLPREGVRFTSLLPRPEEKGWTRMWVGCPELMVMPEDDQGQTVHKIIKDWSPWWNKTSKVFLEKSITNVTRMKWLDENFENAYFIGITRDPYPAIEGIRRRAVPTLGAKKLLGSTEYPAKLVAEQWVDANERLLRGGKAVGKYHALKYEDLVENPLDTLNSLWEFLGVEPVELSFNNNILSIEGRDVTLLNMNEMSSMRLSEDDIAVINPVINKVQTLLNYTIISTGELVKLEEQL